MPLLFVCLVFATPVFNKVREWCAPPKRNYAISTFGKAETPAERVVVDQMIREQTRDIRIAERDYQRRLATWRFWFVTMPKMAPTLLLGVAIIGITMWFIRLWKQGNQYLK